MAPALLEHAMDPFFTTKENGKGTGLGLSMVHDFARQSGGSVQIRSEVGRGTTVRIYFPATDAALHLPGSDLQGAGDRGGTETILVVDDRTEVAELTRTMLESLGYTVLVHACPDEALDRLGGANRIDMLFAEIVMPGDMNGVMLAREARKRRPDLKILLTTGYLDATAENRVPDGGEFAVINKPYGRAALAQKTRQVFEAPDAAQADPL